MIGLPIYLILPAAVVIDYNIIMQNRIIKTIYEQEVLARINRQLPG
jgi:hypothetical protein